MIQELLRRFWHGLTDRIDGPLMLITLIIMGFGLATIYSATHDASDRTTAQVMNMLIGIGVMWSVAQISPQKLMRFAVPLYVLGVILLVLVFFFGIKVNGARRWLSIGFTRIQPSEILKIAMPLMLAWYFHKYEAALKLRHFVVAALLLLVPFGLIAKQPDLGTSILVAASGFYVLFFAGLTWRLILPVAVVGIVGIGAIVAMGDTICQPGVEWPGLREYQKHRVCTLLDPTSDPLGKGFHIIQSTIAIGSGGVLGKGWGHGTQTHLDFLPESHTDFIIAVMGEEFGLVGICALLLIYLLLIGRGLVITAQAQTLFGKLLAGSLTMTFFVYVFVNIGMVSGLLPVVGVPLPFISYGGTSLVTLLSAFGVLMSIHTHRKWIAQV